MHDEHNLHKEHKHEEEHCEHAHCECCGHQHSKSKSKLFLYINFGISFVAVIVAFFWESLGVGILKYFNPAWIVIVLCGFPLYIEAFKSLFNDKKITANLLISIALTATIVLEILSWTNIIQGHAEDFLFAGAEIAFLMMIGEALEEYTVGKSRKGIEKLLKLAPSTAFVKKGDSYLEVNITEINIDDIVLIKPNEKVSVDGVIISGSSAFDQASITGEALPVDKVIGDSIYAGTWNKSGAVEVKVTKKSGDSTVAKLVKLVEGAENNKAPISRLADRWASVLVPISLILTVVVILFTKFVLNVEWLDSIIRGVTILVVFCPCALALAIPTAVAAGMGNMASRGIIVKSGQALEMLSKIDLVAFDKTGTLTEGKLLLSGYNCDGFDEKEFFKLLYSAESQSEHPIAQAIVKYAETNNIALSLPKSIKSLIGVGVSAVIDDKAVVLGKLSSFNNIPKQFEKDINIWKNSGNTIVAMSVNDTVVGVVSVSDTIRANAKYTIAALKKQKVSTIMLTGDIKESAQYLQQLSGVTSFKHSLLPEQKVEQIIELKKDYKVCMVGDGVNDAPSLAEADVAIAMAVLGSDLALEVSDVALMNSDLLRIPGLLKLSKQIMTVAKINIILAMIINIGAVILGALGLLNPVAGALVHNIGSVLVVILSILLLIPKDKVFNEYNKNNQKNY